MENFEKIYNVSRETFLKIQQYVELLQCWNQKINLISRTGFDDIWLRHIADSYQLTKYITQDMHLIYDVGSGAGFPAVILAIWAEENRKDISVKMIESISKKTVYLNDVQQKLKLENTEVINNRSESLNIQPADLITARAVAALDKLFSLVFNLSDVHTKFLFPKGKTYFLEIIEAQKNWKFDYQVLQNEIEPEGVVLLISNLRRKK